MDNLMAHILVVDDDDGIRSLVKKYLNEKNIYNFNRFIHISEYCSR